jgi:hypothetical protein
MKTKSITNNKPLIFARKLNNQYVVLKTKIISRPHFQNCMINKFFFGYLLGDIQSNGNNQPFKKIIPKSSY